MHIPCIIFPLFSPALPPAARLSLPPATRLTPLARGPADSAARGAVVSAPQLSLPLPAAAAYFTVISTEDSAARSPEFTY